MARVNSSKRTKVSRRLIAGISGMRLKIHFSRGR
jgi:hypothetical protein